MQFEFNCTCPNTSNWKMGCMPKLSLVRAALKRKSIVQLKQERRHQGTGPSTHLSDHSTFLCCFCCPTTALCQCATVSETVPAFVKYYFSAPWGHTSWMALFFDTRHIQEQSCVKYDSVGIVVFCMVVFCMVVLSAIVFGSVVDVVAS